MQVKRSHYCLSVSGVTYIHTTLSWWILEVRLSFRTYFLHCDDEPQHVVPAGPVRGLECLPPCTKTFTRSKAQWGEKKFSPISVLNSYDLMHL